MYNFISPLTSDHIANYFIYAIDSNNVFHQLMIYSEGTLDEIHAEVKVGETMHDSMHKVLQKFKLNLLTYNFAFNEEVLVNGKPMHNFQIRVKYREFDHSQSQTYPLWAPDTGIEKSYDLEMQKVVPPYWMEANAYLSKSKNSFATNFYTSDEAYNLIEKLYTLGAIRIKVRLENDPNNQPDFQKPANKMLISMPHDKQQLLGLMNYINQNSSTQPQQEFIKSQIKTTIEDLVDLRLYWPKSYSAD